MKILIIEDEEKIVQFLKQSLEAEFFTIDVARDGDDGAHYAQINDYDLIILDIILPKKDGVEVLKEIRAANVMTPVLILSVKTEVAQKVAMLNAGADDYLTKPFTLGELVARVRAILRRPAGIQGQTFSVGDLTIETKGCTVTRGEKDIYLTRKEFTLLHYLMQNQGAVLSRGMILEHVLDMNTDIFSNTIESHMLSLRKKIGDTGKKRLIQTIPGRGYKISVS